MVLSKASHQGHSSAFKNLEENRWPCMWELHERAQISDCAACSLCADAVAGGETLVPKEMSCSRVLLA